MELVDRAADIRNALRPVGEHKPEVNVPILKFLCNATQLRCIAFGDGAIATRKEQNSNSRRRGERIHEPAREIAHVCEGRNGGVQAKKCDERNGE